MKKLVFTLFISSVLIGKAQKGKIFPETQGATLDDVSKSIPFKNNKYSILAVAFTKAAEDDLKKWLQPLYSTFTEKSKSKTTDMSMAYDLNFVFVPMIAGINMVANEFKASTDKAFWPYVLDTKKSDMKAAATSLGITDRKIPYVFLLDKNGIVVDVQSGSYSEDKIDALEEAIE